MASKILSLFTIAISYYVTLAAIEPSVLDICNYPLGGRRAPCRPQNYGSLKFDPDEGICFTSAIYGPVKIWDAGSSNDTIKQLELETFDGIPQLVTIAINHGSNVIKKYFKWEKGSFKSITDVDHIDHHTSIKNGKMIDNSLYLNLKQKLNQYLFEKDQKIYYGVQFDIVYPKTKYKLIGIIYGTELVFKSNKIYNVVVKTYLNIPRLIMVNYEGSDELKMFLLKEKWAECNQMEAQKFIQKIIDTEKKKQSSDDKENQLVYATLQCSLNIPEQYGSDELRYMDLDNMCPIYPTLFIAGTSLESKNIVLDINGPSNEFTESSLKHHDFDVAQIVPKDGFIISQIIESGLLVWENERDYIVKDVFVYKRNYLPLLIKVHAIRNGDTVFYFYRANGKFAPTTQEDFCIYINRWRRGNSYDKTISYTLYGHNNKFLFKEVHDIEDGVYHLSVHPHEEFDLVRILNGSDKLRRQEGEKWPTFTVTFFDSLHKLLSLNVDKDDKIEVRYFKCNSYFTPLNLKSHHNLFYQYKSQIHIQSDIFFDLTKYQLVDYDNLTEKKSELIPLSGFHVKIVQYGNFVLWKSHKARCLSVLPIKTDSLKLIKLKILDEGNTSQKYFRYVQKNFIELDSEEYSFLKRKIVENIRNPGHQKTLSEAIPRHKIANYYDFDAAKPSSIALSHSYFDKFLLETVYGMTDGNVFNNITFNGKLLWKPLNSTHFIIKFSLYFHKNVPILGRFEGEMSGCELVQYYHFKAQQPTLLDRKNFDSSYDNASNEIKESCLSNELGYKVPLDILKHDDFKAIGKRWDDLICIEYIHKNNLTIDLILFGFEIIWASELGEKLSKVSVIFYEKLPIIIQLKFVGNNEYKYLSHLHGIWHDLNPNDLTSEMKTILNFEPKRARFTIPELEQSTDFDESVNTVGNFKTRKFLSKENLVTTILDGRNRLYSPDSFSFVECMFLYYHGNMPRLLSFREKNLFGYSFDHFFIFKNGWRPVAYSIFEQFYNHFINLPPKDSIIKNSFVYDISENDSRVTLVPNSEYPYVSKYEVTDPNNSLSSVKYLGETIWESPKNISLHTFYLYMDKDRPLVAKFLEEDRHKKTHEIYIKFLDDQWKEVDLKVFTDAVYSLASKSRPRKRSASELDSASGEAASTVQRRRSSRLGSQTSLHSSVDSELDLSSPTDSNKFRVLTGLFRGIVDFKFYEPKPDVVLRSVKIGNEYVWHNTASNLSCSSVRCYFNDDKPALFEILVNDSTKKTKKYKYISFDDIDAKWKPCDEAIFNTLRDSLVTYKFG